MIGVMRNFWISSATVHGAAGVGRPPFVSGDSGRGEATLSEIIPYLLRRFGVFAFTVVSFLFPRGGFASYVLFCLRRLVFVRRFRVCRLLVAVFG